MKQKKQNLSARTRKAGTFISSAIALAGLVASLTPLIRTAGLLPILVPMVCGAASLAGFLFLGDIFRSFRSLPLVKNAESLGIEMVSRSDAAHELIIGYLEQEKPITELRLMLYGGRGLRTLLDNGYLKKIVVEDRALVKILLASPYSEFAKEIEDILGEGGRISVGVEQTIKSIKRVQDEIRKTPRPGAAESIMVRYYNTQIRSALTLINDDAGFLTLSLVPSFGSDTASLELLNTGGDSLFDRCSKHFNAVWERSRQVTP
jgi:hypothetical protein